MDRERRFTCDICGKKIIGLDEYVKHVNECVAKEKDKLKAEEEQKHLEELNAAINKVKAAKGYYEECLNDFKEKYPKEYDLNFATKKAAETEPKIVCYEKTLSEDDFVKFMNKLFGWN